jgi:hypothetical protein
VEWRAQRMDQAQKLFQEAIGPERAPLLKASLALLEDAGATDDPEMLYYRVKAALDTELGRLAQLEKLQKDFRTLTDSGGLDAAETTLNQAQLAGLDQATYQRCAAELTDRRAEARRLVELGDELLRGERYKEARVRYEQARKIDRDNTLAPSKIAMAERFEREAHSRNVRAILIFAVPAATKAVGEYFEYKREEERRKREEAERAAEEAKLKQQQEADRANNPPRRRR